MIEITRRQAKDLKDKGIQIVDRFGATHILIQGCDLIVNPDFDDISAENVI